MKRTRRILAPAFLVVTLLWVYGSTLAPGLTWMHNGADGGDLITATATGGVPHPTGYPLYLLLAGFFQRLPIGPLAFRTNLLSALAMTGAALLVYFIVEKYVDSSANKAHVVARRRSPGEATPSTGQRLLRGGPRKNIGAGERLAFGVLRDPRRDSTALLLRMSQYLSSADRWVSAFAGLTAAFSFALAPLTWGQAVITEVYALHALFVAAILYLSSGLATRLSAPGLDRVTGLTLGLALGNHVTSIFLLPLVLLWKRDWAALWRRLSFIALGLLTYLIIPIRAASAPPVNWGGASTWTGFLWLVSGRLYQDELLSPTLPALWERLQTSASLFLAQFGVPGLILGFAGLVLFFSRSRLHWGALWIVAAFSAFSVAYSTRDAQVYLLAAFLCFAVWIGVAVGNLMQKWPPGRAWIAVLLTAYVILSSAQTWPRVDLSRDTQAEQYARSLLAQTPQGAILFTRGDEAVFSLWYVHFALHERPDVAVVAADLLHFGWYQETLRAAYPALAVPGPLPFDETVRLANPSRPACYVQYPQESDIQCIEPVP